MAKLSLVSLLLTLTHPVFSATVTRSLDIVNDNVSPDGLTRPAILVNGSLPGPLISGNASDTFLVNVTDNLTDTTMYRGVSIHWHGLYQKGHAADDGASWVTQCPIIPNNSFLYNFTAANQTGTYWYHSHEGTQYCDGLRGPLVIYDPEDPHANLYDVDDETTVITLADWYHNVSNSLFPNKGFKDPPPNSTLINGRGRYLDGPNVPLSVVNVTQGLRYRFRIVSVSCSPSFKFQIDGHNMTVIEADGIETEPVTVNALTIYAGQRYSVVVNASQPIGNYWIRAEPSASGAITGFENGINSAVLRYSGAAQEEPTTLQDTDDNPLNEADLVPLVNPGAPGEPRPGGVDLALNLDISLNITTGMHSVNGKAWENPATPVLLQILNGNTDLVPADSLYELPGNSTIELSMPGSFAHPMHLHGHSFDIVRVAGSTEYNYKNPPRRDVVSMGDSGGDDKNNVTIRFVTDNAGPWFLHCHIDWHLASGLAVVFVEDRENINSVTHFSDEWKNLCPAYSANPPDATFS